MRKKRFAIVLTACLLISGTFTMNGTAYADTKTVAYETIVQDTQPVATAEDHDCGYQRATGICVPLPEVTGARTAVQPKRHAPSRQTQQEALTPISGASQDGTIRIGKAYLQTQENAVSLVYAYDQIAKAIDCRADTVEFTWNDQSGSGINADELAMIYLLIREDYPEFFWWGYGDYLYSVSDNTKVIKLILDGQAGYSNGNLLTANVYLLGREEAVEANKGFEAKVQELTAQASHMTAYESELFFHDWLALNNVYDDEDQALHNHDAYGAMMTGSAVCEGYTRAMQLLLNKKGIENYTVSGRDGNVGHTWNVVKLDDGEWYQTDVTWDDQGNDAEDIYYTYFNITTAQMAEDHTITDENDPQYPNYVLYNCTATKYWYYTQNPDYLVVADTNFNESVFDQALGKQFSQTKNFARIYVIWKTADRPDLGKWFMQPNGAAAKAAQSLGYDEAGYSYAWMSAGAEYHFGLHVNTMLYGLVEQGVKDLQGVTIRLYPYGTDDALIEEKIKLPMPDENDTEQQNIDDLCVAEASFTDIEWQDRNDYKAKDYYGTFYKNFSVNLPEGKYTIAVYLAAYGGYNSNYVFVGQEATTPETASENRWLFYNLGDLDDNCLVDSADVLFLKRYMAGWEDYLQNGNWYAADIDNDGDITIKDLMILQRHVANWKDFQNLMDYANGTKTLKLDAAA